MKFIADFHLHSHYSIATSKTLTPEHLDFWARLKGITVIGTGDFTHPGWVKELEDKLEPAETGLFKLKEKYKLKEINSLFSLKDKSVRFMLTSEISSIYKKEGKVRKVHNLIMAPDFDTVEKIQQEIVKIKGNINSDGRPILGLDSRNLLELALTASDKILFIPAHIWTPWFSVLGAKSGFDSIEECYGDLSKNIYAVESGLSSDPPMNWLCGFLDKYTLISNSDAHSPEKIGREANLFDSELSYPAIARAIKKENQDNFIGTVEFFPQEGKYHYDGHRNCGICWSPLDTLKYNEICPKCGKKVTIGVMNRVAQLADRKSLPEQKSRPGFYSLIPLKEILAEILDVGSGSKQVQETYYNLIKNTGPELDILINLSIDEITKNSNQILAEAVRRMRNGQVHVKEGYDGEYGEISLFQGNEKAFFTSQEILFKDFIPEKRLKESSRKLLNFNLQDYQRLRDLHHHALSDDKKKSQPSQKPSTNNFQAGLNEEQSQAVSHYLGPALIMAGPGTGKTQTLVYRILNLIIKKKVKPKNILAITFTNKAAGEIKKRVGQFLENEKAAAEITISTFHTLGLSIIKNQIEKLSRPNNFTIIDEDNRLWILEKKLGIKKNLVKKIANLITNSKHNLKTLQQIEDDNFKKIFINYQQILKEDNFMDLDDLIYLPNILFQQFPEILKSYRNKFQWVLVDEYQDVNYAQYELIKKLMPEQSANLCVIGDPNQAIYGFRGADVKFIERFISDYPGTAVYKLKTSYRCSDYIIKASNTVIKERNILKNPLEAIVEGVKIKISENISDKSEAEFIARTIEQMIGGISFFSIDSQISEGDKQEEITSIADFAVLCRIKRQLKLLEKSLQDHRIPYQTISEAPLFSQEPVKSILDVLKLSLNPRNNFIQNRLLENKSIKSTDLPDIQKIPSKKEIKKMLKTIVERYFPDSQITYKTAIKTMFDVVADFKNDLEKFVNFLSTGSEFDCYQSDTENVTLMTLHAAKGLEFKCVFIVGCENGLLPFSLFQKKQTDLDEERRLFYVGMTRAQKFLFLSYAQKRYIFGKEFRLEKSPFLKDFQKEITDFHRSADSQRVKDKEIQLKLFD